MRESLSESLSRFRERGASGGVAAVRLALLLTTFLCLSLLAVRPAPAQTCPGDCNEDGEVTIDELITLVNIALGTSDAPCPSGDGNDDGTITIDELLQAVNAALAGCGGETPGPTASPTDPEARTPTASPTPPDDLTATPTPPDGLTPSPTPLDGSTATPTPPDGSTASPTPPDGSTATPTPSTGLTATATPTADALATATVTSTATITVMAAATATRTFTPTATPTPTSPAAPTAPPDAMFNSPLDIPLDSTTSVTDFVSYPGGDTEDRVRYDVLGMNPNPSLPGGRARLIVAVSCFGTGTNFLEFFTGGQTFSCGQAIVDREVTADSRTGSVVITAVGGENTYVQWVLTGTATRLN